MIIQTLALIVAAIFSGAATYINLVEQPARLDLENRALLMEWKPAYKKGFIMQSSLALIAGILGTIAFLNTHNYYWLIGAILILSNWPYTLIVILPTNNILLATDVNLADESTRNLIIKWGKLHAVRSLLGLMATFIFLLALT
ncbi:DUF1772 domain-containing protein [Legionella sp. WA2022007384]